MDRTIRLSREEWLGLRVWIDEHGYTMQRDEPLPAWQTRTGPISYAYALLAEAACDHKRSDTDPSCEHCSMLMED